MARMTLRVPDSLHALLTECAKREGVSINQYVVFALSRITTIDEVTRQRSNFESILSDFHFVRIHNQHIVNLKYVKRYIRGSGGSVKLTSNVELNVSKSRKTDFLERLNSFARHL